MRAVFYALGVSLESGLYRDDAVYPEVVPVDILVCNGVLGRSILFVAR